MHKLLYYFHSLNQIKAGFILPLSGILNYEKKGDFFYNISLFSQNHPTPEILFGVFSHRMKMLQEIRSEIKNNDHLTKSEKNMLLRSVRVLVIKFLFLQSVIPLEWEKAGNKLIEKINEKKIRRYQNILYGPDVLICEEEVEYIHKKLGSLFFSNGNFLTQEQKIFFENNFGVPKKYIRPQESIDLSEVLQRQISLKQIYEIFQKIFTYYQLENDWKIEQKEEFKNFSVNFSQKTLCIPGNLESLSLKRLLELIDHEICVHLIRGENTHRTLQTALEGYLKIEEGVAIFHEKNVFGEVDFEITPHHIYLYLAEKFIGNDLKMALHIYMTLENSSGGGVTQKQVENRFLRIKSFSSFSHFGGNKKDLVYFRGLKQVIDLQKNGNYNDFEKKFYFGKMSSKDFSYFQTSTLYREFLSQKIIQPDFFGKLYFDYKILQKDIPETCSKKLILFLDEIEKILQKS